MKRGLWVLALLGMTSCTWADAYLRLGYGYADFRSQDLSVKHAGYPAIALDNYDPGSSDTVLFSAGYWVNPHFRAELALDVGLPDDDTDRVTYTRFESVTGTVTAAAYSRVFTVNGFFHFRPERGRFDPYMGAGVGLAVNRFENVSSAIPTTSATINDSDDTDWAVKLGGGVMYGISDHVSADLGIYYLNAGSVTTEDRAFKEGATVPFSEGLELDLESFNYSLALLYRF